MHTGTISIREDYRNTGVNLPVENPWKAVMNGRIDLRFEYNGLIGADVTGLYMISTSDINSVNTIFELYFNYENLRPANQDPRFYGFSVRICRELFDIWAYFSGDTE